MQFLRVLFPIFILLVIRLTSLSMAVEPRCGEDSESDVLLSFGPTNTGKANILLQPKSKILKYFWFIFGQNQLLVPFSLATYR